jgi:hypothetical protein
MVEQQSETVVCKPREGRVFPGTWPDCQECHGHGFLDKDHPQTPCPACQKRAAAINRDLQNQIDFVYYGRPRNPEYSYFPHPDDPIEPEYLAITWAVVHYGTGVHAGTWPDCPECRGIGQRRCETGWDGHRSDFDVLVCGDCQHRTMRYHREHPNERDLLLRQHTAELAEVQRRHAAELSEWKERHKAELDALPY